MLQTQIDSLLSTYKNYNNNMTGYPLNYNFDYSHLYRFFDHTINNLGDPFLQSNLHTKSY
jgi:hypothetical protein